MDAVCLSKIGVACNSYYCCPLTIFHLKCSALIFLYISPRFIIGWHSVFVEIFISSCNGVRVDLLKFREHATCLSIRLTVIGWFLLLLSPLVGDRVIVLQDYNLLRACVCVPAGVRACVRVHI